MNSNLHDQVWVKVNAPIDSKIAPLVSILSQVEGLETIESCEGDSGKDSPAYVYFWYGDWQTISEFSFDIIAQAISEVEDTAISVELFNKSEPRAKLSIRAAALPRLISVLTEVLACPLERKQ